MYQRMLMLGVPDKISRLAPLVRDRAPRLGAMLAAAAKTERERNQFAQNLIDDHEEQARKHHQHQHQSGGDERLASRRPDDLGGLGAHLLDELERIGHCSSNRTSRAGGVARPEKLAARSLSAPRHLRLI